MYRIKGWLTILSLIEGHFSIAFSDVEQLQMVSTERVLQYTCLPSERALQSPPESSPPQDWPQKGTIVFENMSFAYAPELPTVLHDIHCRIEGGEKVKPV